MKKKISKILSFAIVLVLMSFTFPMMAVAAHIHDYEVIKDQELKYEFVDDDDHNVIEVHLHLCSCGDMFKEHHVTSTEKHTPASGSEVYEGSYIGDSDMIFSTYRYTCIYCNDTYRKTVVSRPGFLLAEETE